MDRLAAMTSALAEAVERRRVGLDERDGSRLTRAMSVLRADYTHNDAAAPSLGEQPFVALTDFFELDETDLFILLASAAPDLDPTFALVMAQLSGDQFAGRPTVALVMELSGLGTLDAAARARFGTRSPLVRRRLITVVGDGPQLGRHLRVPDRVIAHLLGDDASDPLCRQLATDAVPLPVPGVDLLTEALRRGAGLSYIQSGPGRTGISMAVAAFGELGIPSLVVDVSRRGRDDHMGDVLAVVCREAGLQGYGLVVAGSDAIAETDPALWEWLADSPVPVVATGATRWDARWLRWLPFTVLAARPGPEMRRRAWRSAIEELDPTADLQVDGLLTLNLDPEDIRRVVTAGRVDADVMGRPLGPELLQDAARRLGRFPTETNAQRRQATATFADLVLPTTTLEALGEIVGWARHREQVLAQGPVSGKGGRGRGIVALFGGSPGTGKTLAAQVIAGELGLDLLTVELSGMIDKYIGETQKNLEKVFLQAESMNCVLFFDEADALFGSRSEVRDARDRYSNQEVAYLLQRLETFDGIAILATNLRGNLDAAFSRRLHFIISFPDPGPDTRSLLWRSHLAGVAAIDAADPIDVDKVGSVFELTGGEIRNIVMAAAYQAATLGEFVGLRHIRRAIGREYAKLARMLPKEASAALEPPATSSGSTDEPAGGGGPAPTIVPTEPPPPMSVAAINRSRRAAVVVTTRMPGSKERGRTSNP